MKCKQTSEILELCNTDNQHVPTTQDQCMISFNLPLELVEE